MTSKMHLRTRAENQSHGQRYGKRITHVTSSSPQNLLRISCNVDKLDKLANKCDISHSRLHEEYEGHVVGSKLILLEMRAGIASGTYGSSMLLEAITVKQLQDYMAWFKQIKTFVDAFDIPNLKTATQSAYEDITKLFGSSNGTGGWINRIKQIFATSSNTDEDVLNRVNHFLWGITSSLSTLPTLLDALDNMLDGKLLSAEQSDETDETDATTLRNILQTQAGSNANMIAKKFIGLVVGNFKQSVANFKADSVPYVDSKKIATEILELNVDDIKKLSDRASKLKSLWETQRRQLEKAASAIDGASKQDNTKTLLKPATDDAGDATGSEGSDDESRQIRLELAPGIERDITLDKNAVNELTSSITKALLRFGDRLEAGKELNDATVERLVKFFTATELLVQ